MKAWLYASCGTPSTSAVNYIGPMGAVAATLDGRVKGVVPHDFTLDQLSVQINAAPGTGKSWTFTVVKNGVDTAVTVTIADAATTGLDNTNSVSFVAGDTIHIKSTPSGTPAAVTAVNITSRQDAPAKFAIFSNSNAVSVAASTRMPVFGAGAVDSTALNLAPVIPINGVIRNLNFFTDSAPGAGNGYTVTLHKNGSATALTATVNDPATTASDTTNTVTVAPGDRIELVVTRIGTANVRIGASYTVEPTTDGESMILLGNNNTIGGAVTTYSKPYAIFGWGGTETTGSNSVIMPALRMKNFYVKLGTAPGIGTSFNFKVRNAGADTALAVLISGNNTAGNVTANVDITQGSSSSLTAVPTSAPNATAGNGFGIAVTTVPVASQNITHQSVASTPAFGSHTLTIGGITIAHTALGSSNVLGSHTVLQGVTTITHTSYNNTRALGSHTVLRGAVSITHTSIGTSQVLGSHTVARISTITHTSLVRSVTLGSHTILRGAVTITHTSKSSSVAFGSHSIIIVIAMYFRASVEFESYNADVVF